MSEETKDRRDAHGFFADAPDLTSEETKEVEETDRAMLTILRSLNGGDFKQQAVLMALSNALAMAVCLVSKDYESAFKLLDVIPHALRRGVEENWDRMREEGAKGGMRQ